MTRRRDTNRPTRFLGTYTLPGGKSSAGELRLNGADSLLRLYSDSKLEDVQSASCVKGTAHSGECLTLIDCMSPGTGQTGVGPSARYHADVFPHYVAVGRHQFEPDQPCIRSIHFTATDVATLFYDFDAFGHVVDAKPIVDVVLRERRTVRAVEAGESPVVQYFTGRTCIARVNTALGTISIDHQPRHTLGGPNGVFISNRIVVTVEPERPVTFSEAVESMYDVACFLSMAAGRRQGISNIHVTTNTAVDQVSLQLVIHDSYRWKASSRSEQHKPHPGDVPLDPIRHRAEFETVLVDWIARHCSWRAARGRYLGCLRKANRYDSERLVAAANLFDILPADAVPAPVSPPHDLLATRDACVRMLRQHPPSVDRNAALSVLSRFGKPSLPKKVAHRASIIESKLRGRFPDLQLVAKMAVKVRNVLVHGGAGDVDYLKLEPLMPFLTDTLEFIFAASDFIDAGWDAQRWSSEAHGWGHTFARYRSEYDGGLAELRRATARQR